MVVLNTEPSEENRKLIRELYERAFPASEKKPYGLILEKEAAGVVEIISVEDGEGGFLGLVITISKDDLLLLDYFAIAEEARGQGVGGKAIALLCERYADRRFFLETEDPDEPGVDNAGERVRRLNFYRRCGLREMDWRVMLFGVRMRIMTGGRVVNFDEYHEIFTKIFGEKAAKNVLLAD